MSEAAERLTRAIVARDFDAAAAALHPEIDFRAMTPSRIWEADGPAGVTDVLREWLADPDEEVDAIEQLPESSVEDTGRTGWRVRGRNAGGPFVFEQVAYMRERDDRVAWLRVMCTGPRPTGG